MSKKSSQEIPMSSDSGYMYYPHQMRIFEGRVLTFLETLGFEEKREKAVKDTYENIFHDFLSGVHYVEPKIAQEILERKLQLREMVTDHGK